MLRNYPHLDTNQSIFFARQLEAVDKKNFETLFAGILGRRFIPLVEDVAEWANVYTYRMYEMTGNAKIIADGATDLPRSGVKATETSQNIKQIGTSYGWTRREIQQAAATNTPLDQMTVQAARTAVARQVDNLLATGSVAHSITGLLNVSGASLSIASTKTGAGAGTAWIRAVPVTPDEIVADINLLVAETRTALKQAGDEVPIFGRFTVLIASTNYGYIATTPRSTTSDMTILQYVLRNNPWIESIEEWWQCDTADPSGGMRMVCYARDPMALGALIPQEFTSLPPQEEGLGFVIPATGSCGGVVVRYRMVVRYMDNT